MFTSRLLLAVCVAVCLPAAHAQYTEQAKLIGANAIGAVPSQGRSVALSYDGSTLIVGGPSDNSGQGAAWVFVRTGNSWSQQAKLVDTAASAASSQGASVALSADGNTAIVGGPGDSGALGAAWVWLRVGSTWTIQSKLFDGSASPIAEQGTAVALTADGDLALIGGPGDGASGAAWFYQRITGVWTQLTKSVVPQAGKAYGSSVALFGDGTGALIGAPTPGGNGNTGVALLFPPGNWGGGLLYSTASPINIGVSVAATFARNLVLFGAPAVNQFGLGDNAVNFAAAFVGSLRVSSNAQLGSSLAISADGTRFISGAPNDVAGTGAAVFYTRNPSVVDAGKLVGRNAIGAARQGTSIAMSGDGSTTAVGGPNDNSSFGAVWVFTPGPDFAISMTHTDPFQTGQNNATYNITVSNPGTQATSGPVLVEYSVPVGTVQSVSGTGWNCFASAFICFRDTNIAAGASLPPIVLSLQLPNNMIGQFTASATVTGGDEVNPTNNTANNLTNVAQVSDLTITKTHTGNFRQGDTGDIYTITVSNSGAGATVGVVSVSDTLPAGLTPTGPVGAVNGWTCGINQQTVTCTRSDVLAAAGTYPPILVTVNVAAGALPSLTNIATVSGGGEANTSNNTAQDPTTIIQVADLTVTKIHSAAFHQGDTGLTYTIAVANVGNGPTSGSVLVADVLPAGLTPTGPNGNVNGWVCGINQQTVTCTRADALAAGAAYPPVVVTVNVAGNALPGLTNTAVVSGGGELNTANNSASDATTILSNQVTVTVGTSPQGLSFNVDGVTYTSTQTFTWQVGTSHTLSAASSQKLVGIPGLYSFTGWSDGGSVGHPVTASLATTSYVASFSTAARVPLRSR